MKAALLLVLASLHASAQMFPIAGTVRDALGGSPIERVLVYVLSQDRPGFLRNMLTGPGGKFSFEVPKGKYSLTAEYRGIRQPFGQSGPGTGFGVALFTGPDQDTSHLEFRWFPGGAISGRIVDPRGEPAESMRVQLIRSSVNAAGTFRFPELPPGKYRLNLTNSEGWFATGFTADGATVSQGVIDVQEGAEVKLSITASNATGTLKGFVRDGERALPGVLAVLVPAGASPDPLRFRGFQTDSDGSFDFTRVPAGDYFLFAVQQGDFEYATPAVVRPYLASAKPVRVEAAVVANERISLAPPSQ